MRTALESRPSVSAIHASLSRSSASPTGSPATHAPGRAVRGERVDRTRRPAPARRRALPRSRRRRPGASSGMRRAAAIARSRNSAASTFAYLSRARIPAMRANRHASSNRCAWKKCSERSSASDSGWSSSAGDDRFAGTGVQLAPAPERKLLVRGVAQHRVPEAHDVVGDEAEEAAEAAPRRFVGGRHLVGDQRVELVDPERVAEHRRVAEQAALDGREAGRSGR